jgi:CHAD domain-containing protein
VTAASRARVEREVKLGAWAGLVMPDLDGVVAGARVELLPPLRLTATYYDTADLRLARWGVTVRHRTSVPPTDELPWTVKLPAGPGAGEELARRELEFSGPEARVPTAVGSLVRGLSRQAVLVPVARLRTDRRRWEVRDSAGAALLEIADDEVSVMVSGPGGRGRRLAARFRELEVELAGGDAAVLAAVVASLRAAGAGEPDPTPKIVRALGPRALEPPDVVVDPVTPRSTAAEVIRAAIAASVSRLLRHDPGVRLGDDPEDVHQARVATRRLRSDLRTFQPLLDEAWTRARRDELGWIAQLLGAVRDADVLLERLHAQAKRLPKTDGEATETLLERLRRDQRAATEELHAAMDSERYATLLDRLVAAAAEPSFAGGASGRAAAAGSSGAATAGGSAADSLTPASAGTPAADEPAGAGAGGGDAAEPAAESVAVSEASAGGPGWRVRTWTGAVWSRPSPGGDGGATRPDAVAGPGDPDGKAPPARPADAPAVEVLGPLVVRPWRHLKRQMGTLGPAPEDDALHEVRIRAKRCRYAAEAAAPALGKDAARFAAGIAELQTVLGDLHDAVVAEAWLRDAVVRAPSSQALAAGELVAMERAEAEECRTSWRGVWKQAARKKRRAWLKP